MYLHGVLVALLKVALHTPAELNAIQKKLTKQNCIQIIKVGSRIPIGNFVYLTRWRGQLMSDLAGQCLP